MVSIIVRVFHSVTYAPGIYSREAKLFLFPFHAASVTATFFHRVVRAQIFTCHGLIFFVLELITAFLVAKDWLLLDRSALPFVFFLVLYFHVLILSSTV